MAVHPTTAEVWESEHGLQGVDEINRVEPGRNSGRNCGWPVVTYGRNHGTGPRIGEDGPKPGFEHPLKWWVPSVAPSGLAFITSERYPGWIVSRYQPQRSGRSRRGDSNAVFPSPWHPEHAAQRA